MSDELIKAKGASAAVGARKTFGGREYIKTSDGWKYLGKGGGKKPKNMQQSMRIQKKIQEELQNQLIKTL